MTPDGISPHVHHFLHAGSGFCTVRSPELKLRIRFNRVTEHIPFPDVTKKQNGDNYYNNSWWSYRQNWKKIGCPLVQKIRVPSASHAFYLFFRGIIELSEEMRISNRNSLINRNSCDSLKGITGKKTLVYYLLRINAHYQILTCLICIICTLYENSSGYMRFIYG
jgi:hypothetical protein